MYQIGYVFATRYSGNCWLWKRARTVTAEFENAQILAWEGPGGATPAMAYQRQADLLVAYRVAYYAYRR